MNWGNGLLFFFQLFSKPLYVAVAQRKEDRRAALANRYVSQLHTMRMGVCLFLCDIPS